MSMEDSSAGRSYRKLGKRLKELRTKAQETLADSSGAVEIDVRELAGFELGHNRPSEEILLLLISHFKAADDEALNLWELAGYSSEKTLVARLDNYEPAVEAAGSSDKRIIFTDVVDVVVNNYGVVMNFMQNNGSGAQPAPVARVGMSREHAKSVLQILQVTLAQTEQKAPKFPKRLITPDSPAQDQP